MGRKRKEESKDSSDETSESESYTPSSKIPKWLQITKQFDNTIKFRKGLLMNNVKNSDILSKFVTSSKNMVAEADIINPKRTRSVSSTKLEGQFDDYTSDDREITYFDSSPSYIKGGSMRDYQVSGLNWMISLFENGLNGILADEMGLGKTVQTISFLGYMKHYNQDKGPFLVIVPKSTMTNWSKEFERWCPSLQVVVLCGSKEERKEVMDNEIFVNTPWDVLLTSYEIFMVQASKLTQIAYRCIVIDEAHRIKSDESKLTKLVKSCCSLSRLLLTGTPLQNNMRELWTLLNFILPDIFFSYEVLEQWNSSSPDETDHVIQEMRNLLEPFILRRIKQEVETTLLPKKEYLICAKSTEMQRKMYKALLMNDSELLNSMCTGSLNRQSLLNLVMQLRKLCNHPYLFPGVEPGPPYETGQHVVDASGKMLILDKLLASLFEQGSRVLIFSQMVHMLDILEMYLEWKDYQYCRLDGQTSYDDRFKAISQFNAPKSPYFAFLLSTRAGGLGINLQTADCVIFYDNDWNPQVDQQATDRAHRIGQKKQVRVFKFVLEKTVEQRVLEIAMRKLEMSKVFMKQGVVTDDFKCKLSKHDFYDAIRCGTDEIFSCTDTATGQQTGDTLEDILREAEIKTMQFNEQIQESLGGTMDPINFQAASTASGIRMFEGENYETGRKIYNKSFRAPILPLSAFTHELSRGRRARQNQDMVYIEKDVPKVYEPEFEEFQFVSSRVQELITKGFEKSQIPFSLNVNELTYPNLSDEERLELQHSIKQSFLDWSAKDFSQFIGACITFGREEREMISNSVVGKSPEDVLKYLDAYQTMCVNFTSDKQKNLLIQVERAEKRLKTKKLRANILELKMQESKLPLLKLETKSRSSSSKFYSNEVDRFLLCRVHELGEDFPDLYSKISKELKKSSYFRFNWFVKTRSSNKLEEHVKLLLSNLTMKQMKVMNEKNNL